MLANFCTALLSVLHVPYRFVYSFQHLVGRSLLLDFLQDGGFSLVGPQEDTSS